MALNTLLNEVWELGTHRTQEKWEIAHLKKAFGTTPVGFATFLSGARHAALAL